MTLALGESALKLLDLEAATIDVASGLAGTDITLDLVPPAPFADALEKRAAEIAASFRGRFRKGVEVTQPSVLWANKANNGLRPVMELDLGSQVLLAAISAFYKSALPPEMASRLNYGSFLDAPTESSCEWVLSADVASFYDHIDHGILGQILVDSTGDSLVSTVLEDFLRGLMGRSFGLPQGYHRAATIGDTYLDGVEVELLRSDRAVWRYSDDFRIGCASQADGDSALVDLANGLRHIGLTLNERKTFLQTRETYVHRTSSASDTIDRFLGYAAADLTIYNRYSGEVIHLPEPDSVQAESALRVVRWWDEEVRTRDFTVIEAIAMRKILESALLALIGLAKAGAMGFVPRIIEREPQLTPLCAAYLTTQTAQFPDDVGSCIGGIIDEKDYISSWQQLWLVWALGEHGTVDKKLKKHLKLVARSTSHSDLLRSVAASKLLGRTFITQDKALEVFGTLSHASRAWLIPAFAKDGVSGRSVKKALTVDDLQRQILRYYSEAP